jgi:hypothetical protein
MQWKHVVFSESEKLRALMSFKWNSSYKGPKDAICAVKTVLKIFREIRLFLCSYIICLEQPLLRRAGFMPLKI